MAPGHPISMLHLDSSRQTGSVKILFAIFLSIVVPELLLHASVPGVAVATGTPHDHVPVQGVFDPVGVHIAFGETTRDIVVMWSTASRNENGSTFGGMVWYGSAPDQLAHAAPSQMWQFSEGNPDGLQWISRATIRDLTPGETYFYQILTDTHAKSVVFNFTLPKLLAEAYPAQFIMFGDLGRVGEKSPTVAYLVAEAHSGHNTAIMHIGDIAYDLDTDGGKRGDEYLQRIQDAAAYIPYMTCPGNHEIPLHFTHYRNRFTMPTKESTPDTSSLWWSMDIGPVHFISYDTEVFFVRKDLVQAQLDFLNADLAKANAPEQRKKVPWIVAFGHRPMYCSSRNLDDCTHSKSVVRAHLEEIFYRHGVDIIVQGHEHSYERLWPVFNETVTQENYINPRAPVQVISGQAGCHDYLGPCLDVTFGPRGNWSAYREWIPDLFGYGRLKFLNDTHAQWSQVMDVTGKAIDSITIVQESHGPFRGQ